MLDSTCITYMDLESDLLRHSNCFDYRQLQLGLSKIRVTLDVIASVAGGYAVFHTKTQISGRIKGMAGNNQEGDFHIVAEILLMDKILHHQGWWLSRYLQGFNHPRWCRILSINSMCVCVCVRCLCFFLCVCVLLCCMFLICSETLRIVKDQEPLIFKESLLCVNPKHH